MTTDPATVQAYNKNAYAWAGRMRSGKNYAHTFIEKPAMANLIPNLDGLKILALGCGSGEEIELLRSKGAKDENIIGIDIAEGLISIAKSSYPDVIFYTMDMEKLSFENNTFDFVYSSLVLHYIEDWSNVLAEVHRVLKPGGQFLCSTHHPLRWGAGDIENGEELNHVVGFRKFKNDPKKAELIGSYMTKTAGEAKWFNSAMKIKYFNRSLSEMYSSMQDAGFTITNFVEPTPSDEAKEHDYRLWKVYREIPMFVIWKAAK